MSFIAPVWRPLIEALCRVVPVEWTAPAGADAGWFRGTIVRLNPASAKQPAVVSCADVRHEVVESLRWARQLIASGIAKPAEIAIASANTTAWDDHFLACAEGTGFRLHFSHGVSALASRDGQRCAGAADVLMHGLSQQRARRLFAVTRGQGLPPDELPDRWLDAIPRGAALSSVADWKRALETADRQAPRRRTPSRQRLPPGGAREGTGRGGQGGGDVSSWTFARIWQAATRSAPADAIELSLRSAHLASETDAADAVVWCPAGDLAAPPVPTCGCSNSRTEAGRAEAEKIQFCLTMSCRPASSSSIRWRARTAGISPLSSVPRQEAPFFRAAAEARKAAVSAAARCCRTAWGPSFHASGFRSMPSISPKGCFPAPKRPPASIKSVRLAVVGTTGTSSA